MIALWAGATYLAKFVSKNASFIAAVPATFMSAVSCTYIMMAGEGLGLSASISYPVGIVFAVAMLGIFLFKCILKSDTKTVNNYTLMSPSLRGSGLKFVMIAFPFSWSAVSLFTREWIEIKSK